MGISAMPRRHCIGRTLIAAGIFFFALLAWVSGIDPVFGDPRPVHTAQTTQAGGAHDAVASDDASLKVSGGVVDVEFAQGELALPRTAIFHWVSERGRTVAHYYGRFPVPRLRLVLVPVAGKGVRHGKSFGMHGATISVSIGRDTTIADLKRDWIMTHEMVHLAFPSVADEHRWIEEGLATYVEPLARVQTGELDAADVWVQLVKGLPKGLPAAGDRGLDYTPTWGRTYWGGALFCLLADIEIHQRTGNRYGLRDALRAINAHGGSIEVDWPLRRAFRVGDDAVGVPVLTELYDRMRAAPVDVDLDRLWERLGVEVRGNKVVFVDDAALAGVRRAITGVASDITG